MAHIWCRYLCTLACPPQAPEICFQRPALRGPRRAMQKEIARRPISFPMASSAMACMPWPAQLWHACPRLLAHMALLPLYASRPTAGAKHSSTAPTPDPHFESVPMPHQSPTYTTWPDARQISRQHFRRSSSRCDMLFSYGQLRSGMPALSSWHIWRRNLCTLACPPQAP